MIQNDWKRKAMHVTWTDFQHSVGRFELGFVYDALYDQRIPQQVLTKRLVYRGSDVKNQKTFDLNNDHYSSRIRGSCLRQQQGQKQQLCPSSDRDVSWPLFCRN